MKKLFLFLFTLFFALPVFCTADEDALDKALRQAAAQRTDVYRNIESHLQHYYERKNFSDPDRKSGWYRVDGFLQWALENKAALQKDFFILYSADQNLKLSQDGSYPVSVKDALNQKNLSEETQRALWFYLGARYLIDNMGLELPAGKLKIAACSHQTCAVHQDNDFFITFTSDPHMPLSIVHCLNSGIHEATHILPLLQNMSSQTLSETATFYTAYLWNLPVKNEKNMILNIPDLRLYKGDNPYSQGDNYHLFITGPLVFPYLSPSDLFRQTGESWTNDIHIHFWQAVKALLLAEQGLLYELTDINYINSEEIIPLIEKLRIPLTSSALYILKESPAYNFFLGFVNKQTISSLMPGAAPRPHLSEQNPLFILKYSPRVTGGIAVGTPMSAREVLQKIIPPSLPKSAQNKIFRFYLRLLKSLPPQLLEDVKKRGIPTNWDSLVKQKYPYNISLEQGKIKEDKLTDYYFDIESGYADIILKTARQVLDASAAPVPPLPEGYH